MSPSEPITPPEPQLPPTPSAVLAAVPGDTTTSEKSLLGVVQLLIEELRTQHAGAQAEREQAGVERRQAARWKHIMQALFFGAPLVLGLLYFLLVVAATGLNFGPWRDVVGVVRIEGPILPNKVSGADRVIPALKEAFENSRVKAIVLSIDSPGGAPAESERIYQAIETFKKKHPKQVVAVIDNLGASAAYLIAVHADRIVSGKYSLVGSIGATMEAWQLERAIAKVDVTQRVYASGKLKNFLNPFSAPTPEVEAKAKQMVGQVAAAFLDEVKAARGQSLKNGIDYGSGEVWVGTEALKLGLVDAVGTLDEVVDTGWGLKLHHFGPRNNNLNLLGMQFADMLRGQVEDILLSYGAQLR